MIAQTFKLVLLACSTAGLTFFLLAGPVATGADPAPRLIVATLIGAGVFLFGASLRLERLADHLRLRDLLLLACLLALAAAARALTGVTWPVWAVLAVALLRGVAAVFRQGSR